MVKMQLDKSNERLDESKEIESMISAVPILKNTIMSFMGHKVWAFAQFHEIEKMHNNLGDGQVIVTLDHKQKTLTMKYREGQVEYFGKQGMSLLGAMVAMRTYQKDKKTGEI